MKFLVSSEQMKELDRYTIEEMGVSSIVLMERAALAVTEELKKDFDLTRVLVICGNGNNGGDGAAAARILKTQGYNVSLYFTGNPASFSEQMKIQWKIAQNYGVPVVNNLEAGEYTTIVDAVFGVGLSRNISENLEVLFKEINDSHIPVLAVDIPSGIHGTTGQIMGEGIRASKTVTFAYGKTGLYLYPGADYAGEVIVRDVGIFGETGETLRVLDEREEQWIPRRIRDGNKGTFGKVLVAAGSKNMSGAAYFAAKACLYAGAGMVRIFTEESNRVILQQLVPEALLTTYRQGEEKESIQKKLKEAMAWASVEAVGPGLGTSVEAEWILEEFFVADSESEREKTLVVDADGLNLLAGRMELLECRGRRPCILTPHMGEMTRISGYSMEKLKKDPVNCLKDFRKKYPVTVVMKDARTLVGCEDGTYYINITGNSGMASAGSGDVLTGIVAGMAAQGSPAVHAAPLSVWIHGRAGDRAKERKGERSMTASDLLEYIPVILQEIDERK